MITFTCDAGHTWRGYPEAKDAGVCYTCEQAGKTRAIYTGKGRS